MNATKRILAVFVAVLMMAAMLTMPAGAAQITINNAASGHTYEAYQIFGGTLNGETLVDIVWGSGIDASWYNAETQVFGKTGATTPFDGKTAKEVAATLSEENHAIAFAKVIASYLSATATKEVSTQTGSAYVLDGLNAGYYLIKDRDNSQTGHDAYTRYIIQILGDVTIDPKSGIPTLTKGVSKDGASKLENYKEAVSASIGETVYYALTASMHSNIRDYDNCYYQIVDTMPAALTFDPATGVRGVYVVNGSLQKEIAAENYTVAYDSTAHTLTVTFKDVHAAINSATNAATAVQDKIVVAYQATLNSNVILGQEDSGKGVLVGNQNTAYLKYSNNPNEAYNPETDAKPTNLGKTSNATANVYSYIINLHKIDAVKDDKGDVISLQGAKFKVHILENGTTAKYMNFDATGKFTGFAASKEAATPLVTGADGYISIKGLASGTYHFEEIEAPAGYNTLTKEVQVTIQGKLDANTGDFIDFEATQDGGTTVSAAKATGTATVTVTNHRGSILPSTGGMGTTIFYIAGVIMMIGAGAVLVTKKRSTQK